MFSHNLNSLESTDLGLGRVKDLVLGSRKSG